MLQLKFKVGNGEREWHFCKNLEKYGIIAIPSAGFVYAWGDKATIMQSCRDHIDGNISITAFSRDLVMSNRSFQEMLLRGITATIISYYFVIIFQCLPANFFRIYARNMSHIIYISANKKAPNENNYSVVVFPFGASQFSWLACRGYKYWSEQGFTQRFPSFYLAVDILLFNCQELALVQAARRCHPRYDVGSSLYLPPVIRILDILF